MTGFLRRLLVAPNQPGELVAQSSTSSDHRLLEAHYALTVAHDALVRIRADAGASAGDYQAALRDQKLPEGQLDDARVIAAAALAWIGETVDGLDAVVSSETNAGGR